MSAVALAKEGGEAEGSDEAISILVQDYLSEIATPRFTGLAMTKKSFAQFAITERGFIVTSS